MKKNQGITLVAIVVTIVVLLILAAVSINIAFNNNGIFTQAKDAAKKTANSADYEANQLPELMQEEIGIYLVDKVEVGDYVAYNVGTWSSTIASPTSHGNFGGYTSGTNKGTSVLTNNNSYKAVTDGWRVFSKSGSGSTGTVTLISAGCPAQAYYGNTSEQSNEMITLLNNFANNNFVNSTYASSARNATRDDMRPLDTTSGGLRNINSYYWLASASGGDGYNYFLYYVPYSGSISSIYGCNSAFGVRPIVTLKSGVKTNASKDTSFLSQICWAVK